MGNIKHLRTRGHKGRKGVRCKRGMQARRGRFKAVGMVGIRARGGRGGWAERRGVVFPRLYLACIL